MIKVKFSTQGYIHVSRPLVYSPSRNQFFNLGWAWLSLSYWEFFLIRNGLNSPYESISAFPIQQGDIIFMHGTHKFQLEAELAFKFKLEAKEVGTTRERIAFGALTVLDGDWQIKFTLQGPTASRPTFYPTPYLDVFLRGNGVWAFLGYQTATVTINPQTRNEYHSQHSKPHNPIFTSPYKTIAEIAGSLDWGGELTQAGSVYFDNVTIELKRFDFKKGEWVDYPAKLTVDHTISLRANGTPARPIAMWNKIIVNEGVFEQGALDSYVYDVVERTVDGISLTVRLNWLPVLGDGNILETRAPWWAIAIAPTVQSLYYRAFGYRHYALPITDLHVREMNDLGCELQWSYKWRDAQWSNATVVVPGTQVYEKRPPSPEVYTRPRHISKIEVAPTQLGLIVDINPRDAWVW